MSFFPISRDLIESGEFQALNPTAKVFLLLLMSLFNAFGGDFRLSDERVAITLGISKRTASRCRKAVFAAGLLKYRAGYRTWNAQFATSYHHVNWSRVSQLEKGSFWAQFPHQTLHLLLRQLRERRLSHSDSVVYMVLLYKRRMIEKFQSEFWMTKEELRRLSSVSGAATSVKRLAELEITRKKSSRHLFTAHDLYNKLVITEWWEPPDPLEDAESRAEAAAWEREIKEKMAGQKQVYDEDREIPLPDPDMPLPDPPPWYEDEDDPELWVWKSDDQATESGEQEDRKKPDDDNRSNSKDDEPDW